MATRTPTSLNASIFTAFLLLAAPSLAPAEGAPPDAARLYQERVEAVRRVPGLAAFWDFVLREDGVRGGGRFIAYTAPGDAHRYLLEPHNISRDFWHDGAEATLADFPLLGRGPFGQAVQFNSPKADNDLPVLMVPRAALHDTPLDAKGPGRSVSMVVWLIYQSGDHAIAGIWHEGTDSPPHGSAPVVRERGQRQYCLFAGLAANPGGSSAHVSDNGVASFGDLYARHLAATHEKIARTKLDATADELDAGWTSVGFVYDNKNKTVTAYVDGLATEYWVDEPAKSPFYKHAARAWRKARGGAPQASAKEPLVPADQYYRPPETTALAEQVLAETPEQRVVLRSYEYTKVRVTLARDAQGQFGRVISEELAALKANPYYFGHDLYAPPSGVEGGPFTIGRVIHSNRHATLSAYIGGVAVYARALGAEEMKSLSRIGRPGQAAAGEPAVIPLQDVLGGILTR